MADVTGESVLKRKAKEGFASSPALRRVSPLKALGGAVARAAEETLGLSAVVGACHDRVASLAEVLDLLPEGGLLAVLEGPGEGQGVMAMDQGFLSSIIERLLTGQLSDEAPPPRCPTRTDAALCADVIDAILREFEAPFLSRNEATWCAGFNYATYFNEPRPLGLLLEDVDYRMLDFAIDMGGGKRQGKALIALPALGKGVITPAVPTPESVASSADQAKWARELEQQVMEGEVQLDAVLYRLPLTISQIRALKPGDDLLIPVSAIGEVALNGADGKKVSVGRLGQRHGHRALRLEAGALENLGADGGGREPTVSEAMADLPPVAARTMTMEAMRANTPAPQATSAGDLPMPSAAQNGGAMAHRDAGTHDAAPHDAAPQESGPLPAHEMPLAPASPATMTDPHPGTATERPETAIAPPDALHRG